MRSGVEVGVGDDVHDPLFKCEVEARCEAGWEREGRLKPVDPGDEPRQLLLAVGQRQACGRSRCGGVLSRGVGVILHSHGEKRDVVGLFGAGGVGMHGAHDGLDARAGGGQRRGTHELDQRLLAEELARRIHGLGDAVGVEQQQVARGEAHGLILVAAALQRSEGRARPPAKDLDGRGLADNQRRVVAGGGEGEVAGSQVEDAAERSDEHAGVVVLGQLGIDQGEGAPGVANPLHGGLEEGLANGHEQRGGHAFPGDIADSHVEVVVVEQGEIVEIAADIARRF